jgi:hypothetical protein
LFRGKKIISDKKEFKMKKTIIRIFLTLNVFTAFAQSWTSKELGNANTAKDIIYLTAVEKEAITYINLARLYPQLFVKNELTMYNGSANNPDYLKNSEYKMSLIKDLKKRKAAEALIFDKDLYENAKCFAAEQGTLGLWGHDRVKCKKENYAEACSYGMFSGKDIAMQLLIDHNVPDLGHRNGCLDVLFSKIGVSVHDHIKKKICAVLEFNY